LVACVNVPEVPATTVYVDPLLVRPIDAEDTSNPTGNCM